MSATIAESVAEAWYVYGLLPADGRAPAVAAILPDGQVEALPIGRIGVLASRVCRGLFDHADPSNLTSDPDWMSARVRAYHAVSAAAAAAGPFLPLAFGTLFSGLDPLRGWLAPREAALRTALERITDRDEWELSLRIEAATQSAWLERHDPVLRDLAAAVAAANVGTAFLLSRRLVRVREAARAAHLAAAARRVAATLAATTLAEVGRSLGATSPNGPSWTVLAPRQSETPRGWTVLLEELADELAVTGLLLRLTGPWPPYAFARAVLAPALVEEDAHG